jgi:HPt (histidine-containing phosphotransfer) domain-containing protein
LLLNLIFERDSQPLPDLNDLAPELNAIYLSETPSRLEQLRKAIRGHDGAAAFSITHTIKSASGLVGDTIIESLCKTLEQSINRNDFEESWVLFSKMTKHFEAST